MGKTFQVVVNGVKGEKKTLDIAQTETEFNNTTVETLREKIIEKFPELKGETFRMLYTDAQLQDGGTFSKYGIKDRSTIMLIVRLPGGDGP